MLGSSQLAMHAPMGSFSGGVSSFPARLSRASRIRGQCMNTSDQHGHHVPRRDALMWLSMGTMLSHEGTAMGSGGVTAYDFSLSYNGKEFPLSEHLKNKVTVFVNVASE